MFRIRDEQLRAFEEELRRQAPDRLLAELEAQGVRAEREPKTGDVIAYDERGRPARARFRPDGTLETVTEASGAVYRFESDASRRSRTVIHPDGGRVESELDERERLAALRAPAGRSFAFGYDERGRLATLGAAEGLLTRLDRDPTGTLAAHTNAVGARTRYAYDDSGRLVERIDPLGRRTTVRDEGASRTVTFADGTTARFRADAGSGAVHVQGRDGRTSVLEYDGEGRLRSVRRPGGGRTTFERDARGEIVAARNASAAVLFRYSEQGRTLAETGPAGAIGFDHDASGRLMRLSLPWGEEVEYEYGDDDRLAAIRDWEGRRIRFASGPDGRTTEVRYPNGLVERRVHAPLGRLESVSLHGPDGSDAGALAYGYDRCGRLVEASDRWGPGAGEVWSARMSYDREGRLSAQADTSDGVTTLSRFAHDAQGNLVSANGVASAFGAMDQPLKLGETALSYDRCGNVVRIDGPVEALTCRFNDDGTLRSVNSPGGRIEYEYDALGRRVAATDERTFRQFGWAGQLLVWESTAGRPGERFRRRDYLYAPGVANPIALRERGQTYWLVSDARGAVVRAFDPAGRVVWRAVYSPFGAAAEVSDGLRQPWRLAGQYHDRKTGLHYNLARYYHPALRTYLSLDPNWDQPAATNYSYARNAPWDRVDPTGQISTLIDDIVGAVMAVVDAQHPALGATPRERVEIMARSQVIKSLKDQAASAADRATAVVACPNLVREAQSAINRIPQVKRGGPVDLSGAVGNVQTLITTWENRTGVLTALLSERELDQDARSTRAKRKYAAPPPDPVQALLATMNRDAPSHLPVAVTMPDHKLGDLGEALLKQYLIAQGRDPAKIFPIQNSSNQGIDLVSIDGNNVYYYEVKSTETGAPGRLSKDQGDPVNFVRSRLELAALGGAGYTPATALQAKQLLDDMDAGNFSEINYVKADVMFPKPNARPGPVGLQLSDWEDTAHIHDYVGAAPDSSTLGTYEGSVWEGDQGETMIVQALEAIGFTNEVAPKNPQRNGVDLVMRAPDGRLCFFEVKTTTTGAPTLLEGDQANPHHFVQSRLGRARDHTNNYPNEGAARDTQIDGWINEALSGQVSYVKADFYLPPFGSGIGAPRVEFSEWEEKVKAARRV